MPTPLVEGYMPAFGRALLVATDIGVFEALKDGPSSASAVADACGTDVRATAALLNLMVAMRYLAFSGDTYRLRGTARRWLLADSPNSFRDAVLMKALEWRWIEHLDAFVRTGRSIDVHASLTPDEWNLYQRGMRSYASTAASVIARFAPVPKGATAMLDIGGSHGYFSVAVCRRHPGLRATVFDLPGAVEQAAPILAKEGMGDRVVHRAGDALVDDLGEAAYDFILIMSLVHHFDDATNRKLMARAARALRPGGVVLIGDTIRVTNPDGADQMRTFWDLYFAMTSASGTWTLDEMASWQAAAGLRLMKPIRWLMVGGIGLQPAMKPV
jgi:SAM-dependent methyltransferase